MDRKKIKEDVRNLLVELKEEKKVSFRSSTKDLFDELERLRGLKDFEFVEFKDMKARVYYINQLKIPSSDIGAISELIVSRVNHAIRGGIPTSSSVNIKFNWKGEGEFYEFKSFNAFNMEQIDTFFKQYRAWLDQSVQARANTDYTREVSKITIRIIKPNSGGCGNREKRTRNGDCITETPKSTYNNCFFKIFKKEFDLPKKLRNSCNKIRAKYGIKPDQTITCEEGLKIAKDYNISINIMDADAMISYGEEDATHQLSLEDGHYTKKIASIQKRCDKCLKKYYNKHSKCSIKKIQFANKMKGNKHRYLLTKDLKESYNNMADVWHYDIETYRKNIGGSDIHEPYLVGYTKGDGVFRHIGGDGCMRKFVDLVLEEAKNRGKKKLYLNAFNGANFDHYTIFKDFLNRSVRPDSFIVNNGSIISFKYKNIQLFDICKHLQGSLSSNLKALGCKIQKGEFDHDKALRWEDTPEDQKEKCMKYLVCDVKGLEELYNILNTQIYGEYQVNLTSFISTSSLTFNMWKKHIDGKYDIRLPNLKQEKFFRSSVRGGRTYKVKHRFKSKQYDGYVAGELSFDDIDDYMIDADGVSLYPSAMQFEYPVGEVYEYDPDKPQEKGVMGIYKIKYEANKRLAHSVGGRRDLAGALKWDLKPDEGVYTSIDIDDMVDNGYKVKYLAGYYWKESAYIFKSYIDELYKKKANSKKGTASYILAKLWMNGLYGKLIQRPIFNKTAMISKNSEYWKFWGSNKISDITAITTNEGKKVWAISGTPKDVIKLERSITKPTHLGAFVLAYSRRIMLNYMKEANPYFERENDTEECIKQQQENDISYGDTDSIQMHRRNAMRIKNLGVKKLGGITDDLGDNCKIIKGIWIAPKLYMLEYIKRGDRKIHYHFRGKGLNTESLTVEAFERMDRGEALVNVRDFSMKKIHITRNSKQQHIPQFSIVHYGKKKDKSRLTRTVNQTAWAGRNFNGNNSSPWC